MNYEEIKVLCDKRRMPVKELAAKCGITEAGLHQMLRNQSMKIDILEKIADVLDVPVSSFFNSPTMAQGAATENPDTFNVDGPRNIMTLNIPAEEKIKLMGEMMELLRLTTEAQKKVIAAHEAEIQKLKAQLGII
jgi:transcriptional regulator with XRE-family HTH domain